MSYNACYGDSGGLVALMPSVPTLFLGRLDDLWRRVCDLCDRDDVVIVGSPARLEYRGRPGSVVKNPVLVEFFGMYTGFLDCSRLLLPVVRSALGVHSVGCIPSCKEVVK